MKTAPLAVAFVAIALPGFAWGDHYPIEVSCDRYEHHEFVEVKLDDKNVFVRLRGRNETWNEIKAEEKLPHFQRDGESQQDRQWSDANQNRLGPKKLPPDDEQSWTVYFGDHGENSLAMMLTSYKYGDGELTYNWKGQLNMQPSVKNGCYIDY